MALSRVKKLEHIRFFPCGRISSHDCFKHLTKLKPSSTLVRWSNSYRNHFWDPTVLQQKQAVSEKTVESKLSLLGRDVVLVQKNDIIFGYLKDLNYGNLTKVREPMVKLLNKHMVTKRLWEPTDDDIVRPTKRRSRRYANCVPAIRKNLKKRKLSQVKPTDDDILRPTKRRSQRYANSIPATRKNLQKRKLSQVNFSVDELVASKSVEIRSVLRKRRKTNLAYVSDDTQADTLERRYKGLENPKKSNRCYFNAVMQCLLHSPLAKQTIESEARRAQSVDVLCEIRNLFTRMTANDAARFISPSKCFDAVMATQECRALSLNNRQEDAHEFLLKLLEHFDEELSRIAENFSLPDIFTMDMRSTTNCQRCLYCSDKTETLTALSLCFPVSYNEDAADSPSRVLHINSLIDRYFRVENLHEHPCAQCGCIGGTEKKFDIIKAPQLLVLHLSRFSGAIVKIHTLVEFTTELCTVCMKDGNGQAISYRLTGMIRHTGESIKAGHYIAYVLIDGEWYEANDERMRLVSWPIVRSLQAYILFYQRQ